MSFRDRQTRGIPLTYNQAFIASLIGAIVVFTLSRLVWSPLLRVPDELRPYVAILASSIYLYTCSSWVPVNREYAQQFFGSYTGESFPAGFCLLPRLPFPLVSILIKIFASEKANTYLGWTLEGSVSIASITTELFVSGMTKDKIRVSISGRFVFEISAPHTYLSQTDGGKDVHSLKEAIEAEASARMKKSVLGAYTLTELQQGEDSLRYQEIAEAISAQCDLSYEFGVKLVRTPILHIEILSKQVQTIHDRVNAQDLFALALAHSQKLFTAFAEEYRKQFPEADSAEIQAAFASALAQEPTANLNVLKIKK